MCSQSRTWRRDSARIRCIYPCEDHPWAAHQSPPTSRPTRTRPECRRTDQPSSSSADHSRATPIRFSTLLELQLIRERAISLLRSPLIESASREDLVITKEQRGQSTNLDKMRLFRCQDGREGRY